MRIVMKAPISIICTILLLADLVKGQSNVSRMDLTWLDKAKSFNEIFTLEKEIHLNLGDELLGEISELRFSKDGDMLITDRRVNEVWLLSPQAKLISKLSAKEANPGIRWSPYLSLFDNRGQAYVINPPLSNTLYIFDRQGHYQRKLIYDKIFPGIREATFDNEGHLFLYRASSSHFSICKVDLEMAIADGSTLQTFGIFPEKFRNVIARLDVGGGLIVDANGNIYQSNVCGPEIYKFNPDLKLVSTFSRKPIHYRERTSDIPSKLSTGDPSTLFKALAQLSESTDNVALFYLDAGLLVIQYQDTKVKETILDFCDTSGRYYTAGGVVSKHRIFASHGNSLYSVYQPDIDKEGNLPNPVILKYAFQIK